MSVQDVMQELEALGTEQNRKVYRRHGVTGPQFGVSYGHLRPLAKRIKHDHALARELWATGNHDARILACMIADPKQATREELEAWVLELDNYVISDGFSGLVMQSPHARALAARWIDADGEWIEATGWNILAGLADDASQPDELFQTVLPRIEQHIHSAKNRVRHSMNQALITVGLRESLRQDALTVADSIGKVTVDHGETGCVTPAARAYIEKTAAYRAQKTAKKQKA